MSWVAECNGCGRRQDAPPGNLDGVPKNPTTDGQQWWSRTEKDTGKTYHACSDECREKQGGGPPLLSGSTFA